MLNFASAGLSKEVPDDFLIATIVEFKGNSPEANVVLMTDDFGLKLKAGTHGINVLRPPEELRLPDELDPKSKACARTGTSGAGTGAWTKCRTRRGSQGQS